MIYIKERKEMNPLTIIDNLQLTLEETDGNYAASVSVFGEIYRAEANRDYAAVSAVMDFAKKKAIERITPERKIT
jgi:hypothetical protein